MIKIFIYSMANKICVSEFRTTTVFIHSIPAHLIFREKVEQNFDEFLRLSFGVYRLSDRLVS